MSKDSFKVKKGLSIIPVDPTTLVSPEAGDLVVDSTDNNKLKSYDPISATFKQVKGTGGGINYLENGDAESGLSGWSTYADAAGANAVDGTGGTANITLTLNDVTPLRGTNDFLITKDAANRQGEGISIPFTIDSADTAKKLYISLDFLSSANLADGDIRIQVYDVTNSRLIRCNGEDLNGTKGSHLAWFQSDAASVSYRLILHVSTVNALAYTLNLDNVSVGPREVSYGGAMTDWQLYTPTTQGLGTISSIDVKYRRVGSNLQVQGRFTTGTVTASQIQIGLPNNLVIGGTSSSYKLVGIFSRVNAADGVMRYLSATQGNSFLNVTAQTLPSTSSMGGTGVSTGESLIFFGEVEIQGWSSNSVQSEDIGNREIRVRGAGNGGGSVTSLVTNIDFSETEDTSASFNGTQFTAPESGDYHVSGMVRFTSSASREIIAYVNGSTLKLLGQMTSSDRVPFSGVVPLLKGQILSFRTDITSTLQNTSTVHTLHIQKLAQPQTILETETVAARYTSNSGQSIGNTATVLKFEDLVKDSHNAYDVSTGEYTVPTTGEYSINMQFFSASKTLGTTDNMNTIMKINGTSHVRDLVHGSGSANLHKNIINTKIQLIKGDVITFEGLISTTAGVMNTDPLYNYFSIARIK